MKKDTKIGYKRVGLYDSQFVGELEDGEVKYLDTIMLVPESEWSLINWIIISGLLSRTGELNRRLKKVYLLQNGTIIYADQSVVSEQLINAIIRD